MRYYKPDLVPLATVKPHEPGWIGKIFGAKPISTPDPVAFTEQLGGLPFGLPPAKWPKCRDCGASQTFLAQFRHDPDRLELGREGRILMVFQCAHDPGMCATWEAFSGANACLVLEADELDENPQSIPHDAPPLEHAVAVRGWSEHDDLIAPDIATQFYSDETFLKLGKEVWGQVSTSTKLGSVPFWIQSADEAPGPDWKFLGQLDSTHSFANPAAPVPDWVWSDPENFEGRTHYAVGPNFGDGGIAYLFLRPAEPRPEVVMFWQCG